MAKKACAKSTYNKILVTATVQKTLNEYSNNLTFGSTELAIGEKREKVVVVRKKKFQHRSQGITKKKSSKQQKASPDNKYTRKQTDH